MDKNLHTSFNFFNCNLRAYCFYVFLGVTVINNTILCFIVENFVSFFLGVNLILYNYLLINFFASIINFLIIKIYFKEVKFYLDNDFVWSASDEIRNLIFLFFFNFLMVLAGAITMSLL